MASEPPILFQGEKPLRECSGRDYNVLTPERNTSRKGASMKARIVRIGNSRGVRLPKTLIEQAGLPEEVELLAEPGRIVVKAVRQPRAGWAEAAQRMHQRGEDRLVDAPTLTRFDEEEWVWR